MKISHLHGTVTLIWVTIQGFYLRIKYHVNNSFSSSLLFLNQPKKRMTKRKKKTGNKVFVSFAVKCGGLCKGKAKARVPERDTTPPLQPLQALVLAPPATRILVVTGD